MVIENNRWPHAVILGCFALCQQEEFFPFREIHRRQPSPVSIVAMVPDRSDAHTCDVFHPHLLGGVPPLRPPQWRPPGGKARRSRCNARRGSKTHGKADARQGKANARQVKASTPAQTPRWSQNLARARAKGHAIGALRGTVPRCFFFRGTVPRGTIGPSVCEHVNSFIWALEKGRVKDLLLPSRHGVGLPSVHLS